MTSKSKYSGWGLALGAALGTIAGVAAGHIGVWLAIGLAIGIVLGASFRKQERGCPKCAALHQSHEAIERRAS